MEATRTSCRFFEENTLKGGGEAVIGPAGGQRLNNRYQNCIEDDYLDFEDETMRFDDDLNAEINFDHSRTSIVEVVRPQISYSPPKSEERDPLIRDESSALSSSEFARCRKYVNSVRTPVENLAQWKTIKAKEVQTPAENFVQRKTIKAMSFGERLQSK
ncbi:hypothetical protein CDL15_Pgr016183 [Punica granatum]|uniref:Uncharacterized protein n=1 Tax=Punica granatum TaxID=22663 RepID=A0A218X171_PUNGR|nr:hypothetical protein CDL15_Pgr016183 [Punica granatum]PKI68705.1 hypothetical protein CRG98_010762 [Punica granatum]